MDSEDQRILFLKQRVMLTLKPREEKWNKLIDQMEVYETLLQFFESQEVNFIYIYYDIKENLHLERESPTSFKKVALAFSKFHDQEKILINDIKMVFQLYTLETKEAIMKIKALYTPLFNQFVSELPQSLTLTTNSNLQRTFLKLSRPEKGTPPILQILSDDLYSKINSNKDKVPTLFLANIELSRTVESQYYLREIEQYLISWNKIILQEIDYELQIIYPQQEIQYWQSKLESLQDIQQQLTDSKFITVFNFLRKQKSPLLDVFNETKFKMESCIEICTDNFRYLQPLEEIFSVIEDINLIITASNTFFKAAVILTQKSKYYNSQQRIKQFFKSYLNQIIKTIQLYLEYDNILKQDPIDSIPLLQKSIAYIKTIYKIYQLNYQEIWPKEEELFNNFTSFYNRLNDIKKMLQLWINLLKLEKLEIGGQNGELINIQITQIYNMFISKLMILQEPDYDPTDIFAIQFDNVYSDFIKVYIVWEKRLIGILQMTLQQDNQIDFYCSIIQQFYGIIDQTVIQSTIIKQFDIFQSKFLIFLQQKIEILQIKTISQLFSKQVQINLQISSIILEQFSKIELIYSNIDDVKIINQLQTIRQQLQVITQNIQSQNIFQFEQWLSQNNINQLLEHNIYYVQIEPMQQQQDMIQITRVKELDQQYNIFLNYSQNIKNFFEDANTFLLLKFLIPENLTSIITQQKRFIQIQNDLNISFQQFNFIQKNLNYITKPLFYQELEQVIDIVLASQEILKWNSMDAIIQNFIDDVSIVKQLNEKVLNLRKFYKNQDEVIKYISKLQLFLKIKSQLNLVEISKQIPLKFQSIKEQYYDKTLSLLSDIKQSCLLNQISTWDNFLLYQSELQCKQIVQLISYFSLKFMALLDEAEQLQTCDLFEKSNIINENFNAILEIQVVLRPPLALCEPSITQIEGKITLEKLFINIYDEICLVGNFFVNFTQFVDQKNLKNVESKDYALFCHIHPEIISLKNRIKHKIQKRCKVIQDEMILLNKYYYLFETDKKQFLQHYLQYGPNIDWNGIPDDQLLAETEKIIREQMIQLDDEETTIVKSEIEVQYYRQPDLYDFNDTLKKFADISDSLQADLPLQKRVGWVLVNFRPVLRQLQQSTESYKQIFLQYLITSTQQQLQDYELFFDSSLSLINRAEEIPMGIEFEQLLRTYKQVKREERQINQKFEPLKNTLQLLKSLEATYPKELEVLIETQPSKWLSVKQACLKKQEYIYTKQQEQGGIYQEQYYEFQSQITIFKEKLLQEEAFFITDNDRAYILIDLINLCIEELLSQAKILDEKLKIFDFSTSSIPEIDIIKEILGDLILLKITRDIGDMIDTWFTKFGESSFKNINTEILEEYTKNLTREFKNINKKARRFEYYKYIDNQLKNFAKFLPIITNLRSPAIEAKHIDQIREITGKDINNDMSFNDIVKLGLGDYEEEICTVVAKAEKELTIVEYMKNLNTMWSYQEFSFIRVGDMTGTLITCKDIENDKPKQFYQITISEEFNDTLETDLMTLSQMLSNKLLVDSHQFFKEWQNKLVILDQVIQIQQNDQKVWSYLYPIFMLSDDIKQQMPEETLLFQKAHERYITEIKFALYHPVALQLSIRQGFLESLENIQSDLHTCEKKLNDYLDQKRRIFPRFFFISSVDLLDILSKSNTPKLIEKHLSKLTDNTKNMLWKDDLTIGMESSEGEQVNFPEIKLTGPVELWMEKFLVSSRTQLSYLINKALTYLAENTDKTTFLHTFPAQITLLALQIIWTQETYQALSAAENGDDQAVKDYNKRQNEQLFDYIKLIQTSQDANFRQKISTICTVEVHNKDVVADLAKLKIDSPAAFQWQCQLKFHCDGACQATICDASFLYSFEYLGNGTRLVITPLTDRCYITLTQSLHLVLGGAPAGPAGTGKTETTKDLGKALGRMVYVFNCSPEMDYKSLGSIFFGLGISGSWGCFDEFNRIEVEVLSVVAMQVKTVLDGIRGKKVFFSLDNEENPKTRLNYDVGYFITMNPGYAGRTELPDNLKALFRGVAMVVPDFCQITEIMLVSNGFISARSLAKKFTTLYSLNRELLSKQDHYDWGLRAIIAICRTAGMLRRTMIQ